MRSLPPKMWDGRFPDFYWHQAWEVFPEVKLEGPSPVADILSRTRFPEKLDGKRVLDVGALNGCSSFECERRGADEVIALDLLDPDLSGFSFLKNLVDATRTKYVRGTIYNLDPRELGTFDIVICFGVVYHLRYPMLGLDNLRRVAKNNLYLESHVIDEEGLPNDLPLLRFYPGKELQGGRSNWFGPNASAITSILKTAGFEIFHQYVFSSRGYFGASVKPGMPEFLTTHEDGDIYEDEFYGLNVERLFGPRGDWHR